MKWKVRLCALFLLACITCKRRLWMLLLLLLLMHGTELPYTSIRLMFHTVQAPVCMHGRSKMAGDTHNIRGSLASVCRSDAQKPPSPPTRVCVRLWSADSPISPLPCLAPIADKLCPVWSRLASPLRITGGWQPCGVGIRHPGWLRDVQTPQPASAQPSRASCW